MSKKEISSSITHNHLFGNDSMNLA